MLPGDRSPETERFRFTRKFLPKKPSTDAIHRSVHYCILFLSFDHHNHQIYHEILTLAFVTETGNVMTPETQDENTGSFCSHIFPTVWSMFVKTMTESLHANAMVIPDKSSFDTFVQRGNGLDPGTEPGEEYGAMPRPPTFLPKAEKIVAIGDVHGDMMKARRAFRLAGLVDAHDSWIGGTTVAVQVGDILDRGENEVELYYWLEKRQQEAQKAGGALHILNGNHETMNVARQFRYATQGGVDDFKTWAQTYATGVALKTMCNVCSSSKISSARAILASSKKDDASARNEALRPGGEFSRRFLAPNPVILAIGSTVFVHGGLLPHHVDYGLERINKETQDWMLNGSPKDMPRFLSGRKAVVWARDYSHENEEYCDCDALKDALSKVPGAKRMVVGHTIQERGINSACDGRVHRVDVGLSRGCGDGTPEVLVIHNDNTVERLKEKDNEDEMGTILNRIHRESLSSQMIH